ncbi:MAG: EamA family transporter [Deltaproteobacteria bacterium]|nr:EamA family transporter [Deltaproteobacteria bacterium]
MWLLKWIPLFVLAAVLESVGQISFKKGAITHGGVTGAGYYLRLFKNGWVLLGLCSYGVEMVIWVFLLSNIPLSIAFPLSGFQQLIIILFSVFVLKEKINNTEWLGAGLIALGISIIVRTS